MYLLRLDDASSYWDKGKWLRMATLLQKYGIKPIFALIPHNEDPFLLKYQQDLTFWETVADWISNYDWTPALHGYNHVMNSLNGGINPINIYSEFAGVDYEIQAEKIKKGIAILQERGVDPKIFVAPGHTFDKNTLRALYENTEIRIISDTIADDVYKKFGFWFIPQQSGVVRKLKMKTVTFCYHPNTMTEKHFVELERFLKESKDLFVGIADVPLQERRFSLKDKVLKTLYFIRHRKKVKKCNAKK